MSQKSSSRRRAPPDFGRGGKLRREDFTRVKLDELRAFAENAGIEWDFLPHEERDADRAAATAHLRKNDPVWVFGYGSLMWNPAVHVAVTRPARIFGYHRSFCLSLTLGRGSPATPGLMLGLDRGGSCVGLAHKIAAKHRDSELEILWMREMLTGTYVPKWLTAEIGAQRGTVLTFVANHDHQRYIGPQPFARAAKLIATSEGVLGTNRDYLYNTTRELRALGIRDRALTSLEDEVRRIAQEPKAT